ncbi:hypothetical protein HUG15_19815 [Salicibibacter cibarius]|uniref:Uncharacterized protein n=1 Tax=Salicibibacter cibarius TaxID=2743000 RepID=A0A7T6Z600_9BACI|nr:hypothetical protein [Salicibibacter cibarius]QQK77608.1 hypothetical protein HUG15_19815 [Salicibibacter cibarius]
MRGLEVATAIAGLALTLLATVTFGLVVIASSLGFNFGYSALAWVGTRVWFADGDSWFGTWVTALLSIRMIPLIGNGLAILLTVFALLRKNKTVKTALIIYLFSALLVFISTFGIGWPASLCLLGACFASLLRTIRAKQDREKPVDSNVSEIE